MRDCGSQSQVVQAMQVLVNSPEELPETCVTATLLTRLLILGCNLSEDGWIHDLIGPFFIFEVSFSEIVLRAQLAWQLVVAQKVSHRPGLVNLQFADPSDIRSFLQSLSAEELDLFHKCLNGCHITQDGKAMRSKIF